MKKILGTHLLEKESLFDSKAMGIERAYTVNLS
jgi:hypothetical protein